MTASTLSRSCPRPTSDPIRAAWAARGYTPAEVDVLILEGFTLSQPPTYRERIAVRAIAQRRESARAARLTRAR